MKLTTGLLFLLLTVNPLLAQNTDSDANTADPYVIEVMAVEYGFGMPSVIKSGWVTFDFKNMGKETHVAMILDLEDDINRAAMDSILSSGSYPSVEGSVGGPGLHTAGQSSRVTVHMEPGTYVMICGANTPDGESHFDVGMIMHLTVTEEIGSATPPPSDMSIFLEKYSLKTEGSLQAGTQTILIDGNEGQFDLHLVAEEGPSTLPKAFDYFHDLRDPTEAKILGGVEEGYSSYLTVDIAPGSYAFSSHEYGRWGMYRRFDISPEGEYVPVEKDEPVQQLQIAIGGDTMQKQYNLKAGRTEFSLNSADGGEHTVYLAELREGTTKEYFLEWVRASRAGEPLDTPYPRMDYRIEFDDLEAGSPQELSVELRPGNYIIYCVTEGEEERYEYLEGELIGLSVTE